jgi:hypothetical protein
MAKLLDHYPRHVGTMSRADSKPCLLCDESRVEIRPYSFGDAVDIVCRRCGPYRVTGTLYALGKVPPELRPRLSAYTRQCQESGQTPEVLHTENLEVLAARVPPLSPNERVDALLNLLAKASDHPGAMAAFSIEWDYPLIGAGNVQEALFHRDALVARGYIGLTEQGIIVTHAGWQRVQELSKRTQVLSIQGESGPAATRGEDPEWDVFICHASEDKATVVEPLVASLARRGLRVWYDRATLTIGDSLRRSIDEGVARSRFGIVIISPAFLAKGWPQWELDGLVQREVGEGKVILPVWHQVDRAIVQRYSPSLANRLAGSTNKGIEALAEELLEAIKRGGGNVSLPLSGGTEPVASDAVEKSGWILSIRRTAGFSHDSKPRDTRCVGVRIETCPVEWISRVGRSCVKE